MTAPKPSTVVSYASVGMVTAAVLLRELPFREWIGLVGFSMLGAMLIADRSGAHRTRAVPLGVFFLCAGAQFGGSAVWGRHMGWLDGVLLTVSVGAVLLSLVGWLAEMRAREPAQ